MPEFDILQTFLFKDAPIRGQIVRLKATFEAALTTNYPPIFKHLLGESLCAAALLSSIIKFDGKVSLQAQGNGLLKLLFAQSDDSNHLRGIVHFSELAFDHSLKNISLAEMLGNGQLVITLEPKQGERYQGIVNLTGHSLTDCLEDYFHQSEQISTFLVFMVNESDEIASGLLLQRLPAAESETFVDEQATMLAWEECVHLASTITEKELSSLENATILHRLFPTYDIELFDSKPVSFRCSCSRERISAALSQMGEEEVLNLLEEQNGTIHTRCEFCNREYLFDKVDVASIFKEIILPGPSQKQ